MVNKLCFIFIFLIFIADASLQIQEVDISSMAHISEKETQDFLMRDFNT